MRTAKQLLHQISRLHAAQCKLRDMLDNKEYSRMCELSDKEEALIEELEALTGFSEEPIERAHEIFQYFEENGLQKYRGLEFILGDGGWS